MDFVLDVCRFTLDFVKAYPSALYPELMYKVGRPYSCILIESRYGYYICVPFRSHIAHNNAYIFSGTRRSLCTRSGLDYTKLVLVEKPDYIDNKGVVVYQDEYIDVQKHISQIILEVDNYIERYVLHVTGKKNLHPREFSRNYKYSTLPYFHDILGIK